MRNRKNKELYEFYPTPIEAVRLAKPLMGDVKQWGLSRTMVSF